MRHFRNGFVISLALWLTIIGCSSLSKMIEKPKVSLSSIKLQDATLQGTTLVFGLLVENPNSMALEVNELNYDLELAGKHLTSGHLDKGAKVPANDKAIVEVPVAVTYGDLLDSVLQIVNNPTTPYRLKGSARIGPFKIPFENTGELKLSKGS